VVLDHLLGAIGHGAEVTWLDAIAYNACAGLLLLR
jgi:hypothetical protein